MSDLIAAVKRVAENIAVTSQKEYQGEKTADLLALEIAIAALSAAQPAPVAEPVAWMTKVIRPDGSMLGEPKLFEEKPKTPGGPVGSGGLVLEVIPLYTSPLPAQQGDVADEATVEIPAEVARAWQESLPNPLNNHLFVQHIAQNAISWFKQCRPSAPAQAMPEGQKSSCLWWETGEMWESSCGAAYCFESDGPAENEHKFCHKCGLELIVVTDEENAAYSALAQSALSTQAGSEALTNPEKA